MKNMIAAVLVAGFGIFGGIVKANSFEKQTEYQVAGLFDRVKEAMKSAADKATDADKLEFFKSQGQNVEGLYTETAGSIKLTDRGNSIFNGMKKAYNDQASMVKSGLQPITAAQSLQLTLIERIVNANVGSIRESCNGMDRLVNPNNAFSLSCSFISNVSYVRKAGSVSFATREGQEILQILSLN